MSDGSSASESGGWWVVVTGASQGLGAAICTHVAPLLPPHSKVVGMARSQQSLNTTAASVKKANPKATVSSADDVLVCIVYVVVFNLLFNTQCMLQIGLSAVTSAVSSDCMH